MAKKVLLAAVLFVLLPAFSYFATGCGKSCLIDTGTGIFGSEYTATVLYPNGTISGPFRVGADGTFSVSPNPDGTCTGIVVLNLNFDPIVSLSSSPATVNMASPPASFTFTWPGQPLPPGVGTPTVSYNYRGAKVGTVSGRLIGQSTVTAPAPSFSGMQAGDKMKATLTFPSSHGWSLTVGMAVIPCTAGQTPSYVGYVDHFGCDYVSGWAADRNRLNTSILVDFYNGSALIMTVLANQPRSDVGASLGDNGLHGFSIPYPASLRKKTPTVHLRFESSSSDLVNSPRSITCQ